MVSGPDLGVGPGPDLDRTFIFIVQVVVSTVFISMVNILFTAVLISVDVFKFSHCVPLSPKISIGSG